MDTLSTIGLVEPVEMECDDQARRAADLAKTIAIDLGSAARDAPEAQLIEIAVELIAGVAREFEAADAQRLRRGECRADNGEVVIRSAVHEEIDPRRTSHGSHAGDVVPSIVQQVVRVLNLEVAGVRGHAEVQV